MSTDATVAFKDRPLGELHARKQAIRLLREAQIPFLVGGMYAFAAVTGIYRDTKDLDLHLRRVDAERALDILRLAGWRADRHDEVWLYKAFRGDYFVDLIFCSGNGVAAVDDAWFEHARPMVIFGEPCLVAPAEEQMWMRAFVNERERFDGADFNHLLLRAGRHLDWQRLLRRFDRHWELLFGHLMMFRFAYPSEVDTIPRQVMSELLSRTLASMNEGPPPERVCRGTLISQAMYTVDVQEWGFLDGRQWERRNGKDECPAQQTAP